MAEGRGRMAEVVDKTSDVDGGMHTLPSALCPLPSALCPLPSALRHSQVPFSIRHIQSISVHRPSVPEWLLPQAPS